jgi:eukaryotic-like serine/threonine-protein kinase
VPNVVGIDLASASTALTNRGFEVDVQRVINEAPRDRVVAQSPEPRTEAAVGSTVRLTVSDGPGMTTVPDVAGLTRERARARLRDRGFRIREREETSDDVERGRAIGTSPEAGSQLERGRTVTLRLSTGREQVTVPDVVGDDRDEAEAELEGAGLRVSIAERASGEDAGTVLEQDPESGQRVDRGSLVRLVVARAPETLRLPDVTGESIEDATTEISALGLTVRPRSRDVDDEDDDGEVLSQNPGAGQRVRRGSTVTLIVGRFERDRRPPPTAPDDPETTIPPEP